MTFFSSIVLVLYVLTSIENNGGYRLYHAFGVVVVNIFKTFSNILLQFEMRDSEII